MSLYTCDKLHVCITKTLKHNLTHNYNKNSIIYFIDYSGFSTFYWMQYYDYIIMYKKTSYILEYLYYSVPYNYIKQLYIESTDNVVISSLYSLYIIIIFYTLH